MSSKGARKEGNIDRLIIDIVKIKNKWRRLLNTTMNFVILSHWSRSSFKNAVLYNMLNISYLLIS